MSSSLPVPFPSTPGFAAALVTEWLPRQQDKEEQNCWHGPRPLHDGVKEGLEYGARARAVISCLLLSRLPLLQMGSENSMTCRRELI